MNKILHFIIELGNWIRIVVSPTLIGIIAGYWYYADSPDENGLFWGIAIALIGFLIGVIWGTLVWIKKGTNNYMTKIMASTDVDEVSLRKDKNKYKYKNEKQ